MTEGNISSWKVKEGDSFSTGDVLLEIETDKATMDVEAPEDGVMAKIIQADGTKGVQVGSRIAVLAEPGDDISSLDIPPEDSKPTSKQETTSEESKPEPAQSTEAVPSKSSEPPKSVLSSPKPPSGSGQNTKYPFYPAVTALIHENHISESDIVKIPATGPNGRLLKGDVLSYLGRIEADYSSTQSKRIQHLAHMDLSNIKIAPPAEKKPEPKSEAPLTAEIPSETSISLPISLSEVLKVQKRIQDTLGISMPLSTFLARAVDIANDDLPNPKGAKPSSNDLFNAVLGLNSIPTTSRGCYIPQITALPIPPASSTAPQPPSSLKPTRTAKKAPDIIDILTGTESTNQPSKSSRLSTTPGISAATSTGAVNLFSVTVPAAEQKRARTFLERVKTVLQVEPGRLVL
jgi:Biotin-requiring enzyme/e3 binding domain